MASVPEINTASTTGSTAQSDTAIAEMKSVFDEVLQKQMEISKLKSENNVALDAARSSKTSG